MLPGDMGIGRIREDAELPGGIRKNDRSEFLAGVEIDEEGSAGIGPVIETDGIATHRPSV
jgi:hypothetical protein